MKNAFFLAVACVLAASCGDNESGGTEMITSTDAIMSDCPAGGKVVWHGRDGNGNGVIDAPEADWSFTVCNGIDGAPGEDGLDAIPSVGVIESSIYCGAQLETTLLSFRYSAAVFTNGSVLATGSITDAHIGPSGSAFYAPEQTGASTGYVQVVYDATGSANGGWWEIYVDRDSLAVDIVYNDIDVAGGSLSWTLLSTSSGCVVNSYLSSNG